MDIFPEYKTPRAFVQDSWQGMEGCILSSGESIRQHWLDKTSPGDGIWGMLAPSWLGEDIWIQAPKLGSQAGSDGSAQL